MPSDAAKKGIENLKGKSEEGNIVGTFSFENPIYCRVLNANKHESEKQITKNSPATSHLNSCKENTTLHVFMLLFLSIKNRTHVACGVYFGSKGE